MNTTSNLKDRLTTIAGIILALTGTVLTLEKAGVVLPSYVTTTATALGIIAGSVVAYLTGKSPDGTTKTPEQVVNQNADAPVTK